MTDKVQKEETPNPYNANKPWHKGEDKPFISSESLYFEEPSEKNKLFNSNDVTEIEADVAVLQSQQETAEKKFDQIDAKLDRLLDILITSGR